MVFFKFAKNGCISLDFEFKNNYNIFDLLKIMQILRSPNGCPWDKEQDHTSIRKNFIEETYEVCEAIDTGDMALLKEELGDVLLQVVFHSQMEDEKGVFNFDDVADGVCKKLILRHPHIFSDVSVSTSAEVLVNWENIKKQEKGQETATDTLLSVPKTLPALMRAAKVQSRAAKTGFDYPNVDDALADLSSELDELKQAIANCDKPNIAEEMGDLLFSCVNVARFLEQDAEEVLSFSTEKFISRFKIVEKLATEQDVDMKTASIDELNRLWKLAKQKM